MMSVSKPTLMRPTLAVAALVFLIVLWTAGKATAADIQGEAAQPHIFGASLEAQVDPLGEDTSCRVEYTTVAAFEGGGWSGAEASACSPAAIPSAAPAQRVTAELSGLSSDTEYRYRFVVTTASDVVEGSGGTFHTFGIEAFTIEALDAASNPDNVAGSHPYELVTRITLPHGQVKGIDGAAALAKDILAELPPGLVGNPTAAAQCVTRLAEEDKCSGDSQVGLLRLRSAGEAPTEFESQIYNMTPATGQAARLGGEINLSTNAYIGAGVRTGDDYGINAGSFNLPTLTNPFEFEIRLWGVPADPVHDSLRACGEVQGCSVTSGTLEKPFLRNPTRCGPRGRDLRRTGASIPPGVRDAGDNRLRQTRVRADAGCAADHRDG
jgi:hypothetical protein